jgi:hypothetical protein
MIRRSFLKHLAALPLVATAGPGTPGATGAKLKIMIKSAWGSDDPTKAAFPFLHGDALSEAGHEIQIFLLGEAVSLMRKSVAIQSSLLAGLRCLKLSVRSRRRKYRSTRVARALAREVSPRQI